MESKSCLVSRRRPEALFILLLTAAAAALRFHFLGVKSFWLDEASSVTFARQPWLDFLHTMWWGEANMAFYYLILRGWLHFGDSEFWLRSLSVAFGVLAVPAVYALGKRFVSSQVGIAAAILLTIQSFHIQYSQELRSYSLVVLLLILSTYAFLALMETPDRSSLWLAYVALSVLAIYTQVFALFVIASQWIVLTPSRIKRLGVGKLLSAGTAMATLVVPIVLVMRREDKGQLDWVPRPSLASISGVLENLDGKSAAGSQGAVVAMLLLGLYLALWICAIVWIFRRGKQEAENPKAQAAVSLFALWLIFPLAVMIGISWVKPIFYPRYLLMCVPAAILLASQGLVALYGAFKPGRLVASGVFLLLIVLGAFECRDYYSSFKNYGNNWRGVANYILEHEEPADAVIFYTFTGHRVFEYYAGREGETNHGIREPAVLFPLELDRASIEKRTEPYHRIWLVLHQTRGTPVTDQQSRGIREALHENFQLRREKEFTGDGPTQGESGAIWVGLYTASDRSEALRQ